MILPKKLQPVTENELLEEVAKELKIDIKDVNKTFNIWLDFVDYIANETDQAMIRIPKIADFYVSVHKMRRGMFSERQKKFKERKLKEIKKASDNSIHNVHEKCVPILIKYGIKSKKFRTKGQILNKDEREYYTDIDLINIQNKIFFKEDRDFSEQKKLEQYFIYETDKNN